MTQAVDTTEEKKVIYGQTKRKEKEMTRNTQLTKII
jgi:hypothetical protein